MRSYRRAGVAGALAVVSLFAVTSASRHSGGPGPDGAAAALPPFVTDLAGPDATGDPAGADSTGTGPGATTTAAGTAAGGAAQPVKSDVRPLPAAQAVRELKTAADTPPVLSIDANGHVRSVSAPPGRTLRPVAGAPKATDAGTQAAAFVNRYGSAFGLRAGQQARRTGVTKVPGGDQVVRFRQYAGGLPVVGGDLVVTVNPRGGVVEAVGEAPAGSPAATTAKVSKATASATAVSAAGQRLGLKDLRAVDASLWLYDGRVIGAPTSRGVRPTWWVKLAAPGARTPEASAFVDAVDGGVALVISEHRHARHRLVCDLANQRVDLDNPATYDCSDAAGGPAVTRREGQAASSVLDVNRVYDYLGHTHDFYRTVLGRDSIDGRGMEMRATVRACDARYVCPFPNAFWDGEQVVFGAGFSGADDVVAHELTHGMIDHGPQLLYAYQAGAINEALADIFGELVDQANGAGNDVDAVRWLVGEDIPASTYYPVGGALRDMRTPAAFDQPDRLSSPLWVDDHEFEDNGGVHTNSGVANKAAYLIGNDPGTPVAFNGQTVTGLGTAKSAQLWYRVLTTLTSGSSYGDLGRALSNGCRRLVGYRGITVADCVQVDRVVRATEMDTNLGSAADDASVCETAGQPVHTLFSDGFEAGAGNWAMSGPNWQVIPSATVLYRYARTGRGSLNGWTIGGGVGASAALVDGVTLPATGEASLRFSLANFLSHPTASANIKLEYNDGAGWVGMPATTDGIDYSGGFHNPQVGYGSTRFRLGTLAGKTVRFRFVVTNPPGEWVDAYIDDFTVYQCVTTVGSPENVAAEYAANGTSAQLTWAAPAYTGPGVANYEVSVLPALGDRQILVPAGATGHTLTGLDPARRYRVTVRAIGTDGVPGVGVTLPLAHSPNIDCSTAAWVLDPTTGRRVPPWPCPGGTPRTIER